MPEFARHFINPGPEVVGRSRGLVSDALDTWGVHTRRDDVILSTSELVTNVLLHTCSDVLGLFLWLRHQRLRIEVHDGVPGPVRPRRPDDSDPGGRGLLLLRQVSDRWGSYDRPPGRGKVVYAEFETA